MLSRLRNNGPNDLWVIINYYANSSLTINPRKSLMQPDVHAPTDELHVKVLKKSLSTDLLLRIFAPLKRGRLKCMAFWNCSMCVAVKSRIKDKKRYWPARLGVLFCAFQGQQKFNVLEVLFCRKPCGRMNNAKNTVHVSRKKIFVSLCVIWLLNVDRERKSRRES